MIDRFEYVYELRDEPFPHRCTRITVTADGQKYTASFVGSDPPLTGLADQVEHLLQQVAQAFRKTVEAQ